MKDYVGKLAIYSQPDTGRKWLVKLRNVNYIRCTGDLFRHKYADCSAVLIKNIDNDLEVDLEIRTGVKTKLKKLEFICNPSESLVSLFE
jgi:hypothetical protein